MPNEIQKITADGGTDTFAPSKESIAVTVELTASDTEQFDRVHFVVRDRDGSSVFRETWARKGVEESFEGVKKRDGADPPTSFTWGGEKSGGGYVSPLGSPYQAYAVAEISQAKPLEKPALSPEPVDVKPCIYKQRLAQLLAPKLHWALRTLKVVASGVGSPSFSLRDSLLGRLGDPNATRFTYAPGQESGVRIDWEFGSALEGVDRGTLELFATGKKDPIWSLALDKAALEKKTLALAGEQLKGLEGFLKLLGSPYKLRLKVTGSNEEAGYDVAWTYLFIVVDRLELSWAPAAMIPSVDPENRPAWIRRDEALLLRSLKKSEALRGDADELDEKAVFDQDEGAKPLETARHEVELRSNIFYQKLTEWSDGTFFKKYAALWGDGPRIPLTVKALVRNARGKGVVAPTALEGAKVLWDWEDPQVDKETGLETEEWLKWAFNREPKDATDLPRSTNCPKTYGGKRDASAGRVFPTQAGIAADTDPKPGEFPFKVDPATGVRPWASWSEFRTRAGDPYQGTTGVLFRPSRIAGDTYRVRAYLYLGDPEDFTSANDGAALWRCAREAGLPSVDAGNFETWRRVDVLRYYRKSGKLPALDFAAINAKFKPARLRLHVPAPADDVVALMWGPQGVKAVVDDVVANPPMDGMPVSLKPQAVANMKRIRNELQDPQLPDDPSALARKTYGQFFHSWIVQALKNYRVDLKVGSDTELRVKALITTYDKKGGDQLDPPLWRQVTRELTRAELDKLSDKVSLYPFNLKEAVEPSNQMAIKPHAAVKSTKEAAVALHLWFQATSSSGDFLPKNVLAPLLLRYVKSPTKLDPNGEGKNLAGKSGLHLFHFALPVPTKVDNKGAAFPLLAKDYGGTEADAGRQGACYFAAPDLDGRLTVEVLKQFPDTLPDPAPGRITAAELSTFLSKEFIDDPEGSKDFQGALISAAHAGAAAILATLDNEKEYGRPKSRKDDSDGTGFDRERDLDLWWDYVQLMVRGADRLVDLTKATLEALITPDLVDVSRTTGDDQDVFLSLDAVLRPSLACKLHFRAGTTRLTWNDNQKKTLAFLIDLFSVVQVPLGKIHIHYKDTGNGRLRRDEVKAHLQALLGIIAKKLKINPPLDIRALVAPELDEREIAFSISKTDKSTKVKFDALGADLSSSMRKTLREFHGKVTAGGANPTVFVFFRDSSRGRHRRLKVVGYLDKLFGRTGREDRAIADQPLDRDSLVAHEVGHTLFLEHAEPAGPKEEAEWRHVAGHNCLMNYDPTRTEFCGSCLLFLRGWDIGTKAAPKLTAGAPHSVNWDVPVHHQDGEEVVEPDEFPAEPVDGRVWVPIGWHGTRATHRESLKKGLKATGSAWDPLSGGELGKGFYVTTMFDTACLYGAGLAAESRDAVDVWRVESDQPLASFTPIELTPQQQWAKVPKAACEAPNDYCVNSLDKPVSQLKFNLHSYPHLRVTLFRGGMSIDEAGGYADAKYDPLGSSPPPEPKKQVPGKTSTPPKVPDKLVRRPTKVVPTQGDGDCFFYSIAYYVKAPPLQADFADGTRTYGNQPAEVANAKAVRMEIADELSKLVYGKSVEQLRLEVDPALTPDQGARYEDLWSKLSNEGQDTDHWGASLRDTIQDMAFNNVEKPGGVVWGDIQFIWWVLLNKLYPQFKRIIVHHGGSEPQVYGAADGAAMVLHHVGAHYEVVLSMEA